MAKYLMLKHYRGAPAAGVVPMDQWTPEEITAHIRFMEDFADELRESGELVEAQALAPRRARGSSSTARAAAGHRRAVRRDQGPDRGVDGDRRRQLRAGGRAGGGVVRGARPGRCADLRVAGAAAVHDPPIS